MAIGFGLEPRLSLQLNELRLIAVMLCNAPVTLKNNAWR